MGPVSLSSPEAGRRTHRAFDRAFIGLLHQDERLSHTGQSLSTTGSAVIERHGLCREKAALHEVDQHIVEKCSQHQAPTALRIPARRKPRR